MLSRCLLVHLVVLLHVAFAGVQRGLCYCNVGVCYKTVDGETVLCKTDEDFYGPNGEKDAGRKDEGL